MGPVFNIEDFGAVGDGQRLNTAAIQAAVDACAGQGGGRVLVPPGTWISGPIFLRSNIDFHLSAGALLRGSRDMSDYPRLDIETHGYEIRHWHASVLTGCKLENVSITGRGVIDGEGDLWWAARDEGRLEHNRPVVIYLCDCERVLIADVEVRNSPSWTVLPLLCRNVVIRGVTITNPWKPYCNCDGINPVSCNGVRISDCYLDTGDDGITLKTLPDWYVGCDGAVDYERPHIPCENVLITNCVVRHAHGGVTLGAEVIGGIRNVTISNCVFDGTRAGIRIYRYPWPGGYVENVRVSNVVMQRVEWVFHVTAYWDPEKIEDAPGAADTPAYRGIHFSDVTATRARIACEAEGLASMPLSDLSWRGCRIESDVGFRIRDAQGVYLDDVSVACGGPALTADRVSELESWRFDARSARGGAAAIELGETSGVWVHGCRAAAGTGTFVGLIGERNRRTDLQDNRLPPGTTPKGPADPAPYWQTCTHAYSGSVLGRRDGEKNAFLPVTAAAERTVRDIWEAERVDRIFSIARVESEARAHVKLPPGDDRRVYVIEAHDVVEKLVVCEDGELLKRVSDPEVHAYWF